MTHIRLIFLTLVVSLVSNSQIIAQNNNPTVTGTVTEATSGEILPGVNVIVKGTSTGISTDIEGKFELNVPSLQDTLVFTFIGYQAREEPINGRSTVTVQLQPQTISGEELVVVGYGTQRRQDVTGAVSKIGSEEIASVPASRIDQTLQGKVAGVQVTTQNGAPGSGTSIRIRGGNSISADNEPLFVIDGFVGAGNLLNSINPKDIESIEVLKDATATSIYGARGANGVIIVTTKRGQRGGTSMNINVSRGVQQLANSIDLLEGPERARYQNDYADFLNQDPPFPDGSEIQHFDWIEQVTQTAPMTDINLSVSGGDEDTRYFLSGNVMDQEGIIKNSGFTRYNLRLNADKKVTDWLDLSTQLNLSRTKHQNNTVSLFSVLKETLTFLPFYQDNGSYTYVNPISGTTISNPIAQHELVTDNTYSTDLLGNIEARLQPVTGLEIKSTFGFDIGANKNNQYQPGTLPVREEQGLGGFASVSTRNAQTILNENTINYNWIINSDHRLNLLGGFTYQHFESENLWADGSGFSNDVLTFNSLATGDPDQRNYNTGASEWAILSSLGRINYSLKDKYLFTLVARRDGSSRLAENHKWAFFPSAAVAWRLSEEPFIQQLGIFDALKLRASYGKTGNQAIGVYQSLPSLATNTIYFNGTQQVGFSQGSIAKPDLKWETTSQFDVGMDAEFFSGRLALQLDYYHKRTQDLLLTREIPAVTGYRTILDNVGEVENKGLELMVNGTPIQTNDFSWNVTLNVAGNRNRVLDLGGKEFIDLGQGSRLVVGEPAAVFIGAVYEGTWNTQQEIDDNPGLMPNAQPGLPRFKDVNGNGIYDGYDDYTILGSAQPDFYGGIRNAMNYRNLDLEFFFQFSSGNEVYNDFGSRLFYGGFASNIHAIAEDRWTPENPDSDIPRAGTAGTAVNVNNDSFSTNVQDGSFLRLRTLRLAYHLPIEKLGLGVNRASVSLTGYNLLLFDNYDWGWDPEVSTRSNSPVQQGFGGTTYPQNRSFHVGLDVNF